MADVCMHHSGVEKELDALCKRMDLRFGAYEKALVMAKDEMDRRLEGMNEFRAQLNAQTHTFATKAELCYEVEKIDLRIAPLTKIVAVHEGETRWTDYLTMAGISGLVVLLSKWLLSC